MYVHGYTSDVSNKWFNEYDIVIVAALVNTSPCDLLVLCSVILPK